MLELPGDMPRVKRIVKTEEEGIKIKGMSRNESAAKCKVPHPFEAVQEQNKEKIRELLMSKKSLKEITGSVGCNAAFVYQVRRNMISELLDGNVEAEVISRPYRSALLLRVAYIPFPMKNYGSALIGMPPPALQRFRT